MKKFTSFMALLAMPILTYAYYDDYSIAKSSPSPTEIIITIILIVWGILNIILFFKIWGMTNDVKHLRKIYEEKQPKHNLNNAVANYYIKKDLYGQEAANEYLKEIIETEYKALGVQLQKSRIERLNNKLQKKIGVALTDANINLSSLSEYQTYLTSIYGEFIPGTKVKVNGSSEVCEICNITEDGKLVIKTYAGYKYTYNMEELSIVKTEAE